MLTETNHIHNFYYEGGNGDMADAMDVDAQPTSVRQQLVVILDTNVWISKMFLI